MFYWVAKDSKSPMDKWRFDITNPYCPVALSKSNVFLLIYCKLKTNFIAKSQLLYTGCPLMRECKQNLRKIPFALSKVPASAYERVSTYGNVEIQSLTGR